MTSSIPTLGYKMAWIAVKNGDPKVIMHALHLKNPQIIGWEQGVNKIYENHGNEKVIFATPQIKGWSLVAGWYFFDLNQRNEDLSILKNYILGLSKVFEEAQAFATHRVSEYHHWILARDGKIERCFAFSGESGKILCDEGKPTTIEIQLPWDKLKILKWAPNEESVLNIAENWSINPTKINPSTIINSPCYIANIPS